jgi:hypothetical protein
MAKARIGELDGRRDRGRKSPLMVVSEITPIPAAYAGKYVAMLPDNRTVVAVGPTYRGAKAEASKAGSRKVAVTRIPRGRSVG